MPAGGGGAALRRAPPPPGLRAPLRTGSGSGHGERGGGAANRPVSRGWGGPNVPEPGRARVAGVSGSGTAAVGRSVGCSGPAEPSTRGGSRGVRQRLCRRPTALSVHADRRGSAGAASALLRSAGGARGDVPAVRGVSTGTGPRGDGFPHPSFTHPYGTIRGARGGGGATGKQKIAPGGSTGNGTAWHRALSSGSSDGSLVPFFCLYSPEVTAHI